MVNRMMAHWTMNLKHLPVSPAMLFAVTPVLYILYRLVYWGEYEFIFNYDNLHPVAQEGYYFLYNAMLFVTLSFWLISLIYFIFPKLSGRVLNQKLGYLHFCLTTLLVYLIWYLPQIFQYSIFGTPRRYYVMSTTEDSALDFFDINAIVTILALLVASAQLIFVYNLVYSAFRGKKISQQP